MNTRPVFNLPIVMVDDDGKKLGFFEDVKEVVAEHWPGREFRGFTSIPDSLVMLAESEPFVLILDHDLGAGRDEDLAHALGVPPETGLKGIHLCAALRKAHPLGLTIPVVYLTGRLVGSEFLRYLREMGPFLPNFMQEKAPVVDDYFEIICRLDGYWDLMSTAFERASEMSLVRKLVSE